MLDSCQACFVIFMRAILDGFIYGGLYRNCGMTYMSFFLTAGGCTLIYLFIMFIYLLFVYLCLLMRLL